MSSLPYGKGRSYGDSCLNDGNRIIDTRWLDQLIEFDETTGVLRCEAGVGFDELLRIFVPRGWFPPVTPGTKFVTVGGAIANDIHGKNHHQAGSFGHFVRSFELLRSDGNRLFCSPAENPELFRATIGGLGLTGLISWAEFTMRRISSPYISQEILRFGSLEECIAISHASSSHEYTVAWLDCLAPQSELGRGVFFRGSHAEAVTPGKDAAPNASVATVPFDFPSFALNRMTVRAFNTLYRAIAGRGGHRIVHYEPFFYPLDRVRHWNRVYGRRGLIQWQCVVPPDRGDVMREILSVISSAGLASFLVVFKTFGTMPPAGLLSFPRPGMTLALDFPVTSNLLPVLAKLDVMVREARGAVYPAKDARMTAESFTAFFPQWKVLAGHVDPGFSSSFWRRVTTPSAGA
jgi:FAD/FMN-containing dehydrogenase